MGGVRKPGVKGVGVGGWIPPHIDSNVCLHYGLLQNILHKHSRPLCLKQYPNDLSIFLVYEMIFMYNTDQPNCNYLNMPANILSLYLSKIINCCCVFNWSHLCWHAWCSVFVLLFMILAYIFHVYVTKLENQ